MFNRLFLGGCLMLVASGCSSYESHFGCGTGEGMRCASMDKVHRAIDRDELLTWDVTHMGPKPVTKDQHHQRSIHVWVAPSHSPDQEAEQEDSPYLAQKSDLSSSERRLF